ncbi:SMP-30/gluconolactonase/LRE family protein [Rhizobium skierniewicense]|uniref:SMP-30/gluconolactonase/LRE family protein n=1 Tax=Rhizobium skierniewicense TaxID=984260 RepID=UPI0015729C0C|nr:SMP-30/gluconolactonase/LRE family protein [Rhizobium skierniewicense]NTF34488.1 SMP-30/gluconolactonase/LRE family protein [Rhizobium skierniewicense]
MASRNRPVFVAQRVARPGCITGETPVWEPDRSRVTWVDAPGLALYRMTYPNGVMQRFDLPVKIGALAIRAGGGFIASTERGFATLTLEDDAVQLDYAGGPNLEPGWRMNDGACDRQGRFWSGSMAPDTSAPGAFGTLFSIGQRAEIVERGGRFRTQNGLAWSPDGTSMYVSDSNSLNPHVMRHDFDTETGEIGAGRLFADHATLGGRPDGAAMDIDGCYWIAASDSGRILRMTPAGVIDAEIRVDVPNATNMCFIGEDLKTAFITSLRAGGSGPGGDVYAVDLPFQGLAEPLFQPE